MVVSAPTNFCLQQRQRVPDITLVDEIPYNSDRQLLHGGGVEPAAGYEQHLSLLQCDVQHGHLCKERELSEVD